MATAQATAPGFSTKSAKRDFLVRVAGVAEYFATITGGRRTAPSTKVYDGGKLEPDILTGPGTSDDITVSRPYDAGRDAPVIAKLYPLVGRWRTTVSVTPTNSDLRPVAKATTYHVILTGCTPPETDADSGDPARLELTFGVGAVT